MTLQADSIAISLMKVSSDEQVRRKKRLVEYFEGKTFSNDSITHFFVIQWTIYFEFNPITITVDELKSTGRFGIIQNVDIRKQIISTYNTYTIFTDNFQPYYERNREELRKLTLKIPGVIDYEILRNKTKPNIIDALNDDELKNRILANYAIRLNIEIGNLQNENQLLLKQLKNYLFEL